MASRGGHSTTSDGTDFSYRQTIEDRYRELSAAKNRVIQLLIGSVIFAASASAVMMFAEGLRSASSMGSVLNDRITVSIMFGVGSVLSSLGTIYVQSPVQKRSNALLNAYILVNTINAVIIGAVSGSNYGGMSVPLLVLCIAGIIVYGSGIVSALRIRKLSATEKEKQKRSS